MPEPKKKSAVKTAALQTKKRKKMKTKKNLYFTPFQACEEPSPAFPCSLSRMPATPDRTLRLGIYCTAFDIYSSFRIFFLGKCRNCPRRSACVFCRFRPVCSLADPLPAALSPCRTVFLSAALCHNAVKTALRSALSCLVLHFASTNSRKQCKRTKSKPFKRNDSASAIPKVSLQEFAAHNG